MKKYLTLGLAAVATCAVAAPAAQAGFSDEFDAADQVERVAAHRYHIDPLVSCRTIGRNSFTCRITDFKGDCSYSGRANVRKVSGYTYRVTTMRVSKSCF
jgi:hypothetical protein